MKNLVLFLCAALALAVSSAFAAGSVGVGIGSGINGGSGTPYMVEGRYSANGFFGAASYQGGVRWTETTSDNDSRVATSKSGYTDILGFTAGLISDPGPLTAYGGGGMARIDYGDNTAWEPVAAVGLEYGFKSFSVGGELKRLWAERIGPTDTVMAIARFNF